jgi:hypothetical protein
MDEAILRPRGNGPGARDRQAEDCGDRGAVVNATLPYSPERVLRHHPYLWPAKRGSGLANLRDRASSPTYYIFETSPRHTRPGGLLCATAHIAWPAKYGSDFPVFGLARLTTPPSPWRYWPSPLISSLAHDGNSVSPTRWCATIRYCRCCASSRSRLSTRFFSLCTGTNGTKRDIRDNVPGHPECPNTRDRGDRTGHTPIGVSLVPPVPG